MTYVSSATTLWVYALGILPTKNFVGNNFVSSCLSRYPLSAVWNFQRKKRFEAACYLFTIYWKYVACASGSEDDTSPTNTHTRALTLIVMWLIVICTVLISNTTFSNAMHNFLLYSDLLKYCSIFFEYITKSHVRFLTNTNALGKGNFEALVN